MPIYEYACKNCNHEYETLTTSVKEAEALEKEIKCPLCGSIEKERAVPKKTSFQLKGKGWYRDGYKG